MDVTEDTLKDTDFPEAEVTSIDMYDKPSTSSINLKKGIQSHVGPLSNIFHEDKVTETTFSQFFELPQILDSDENLSHFAGT